MDVLKKFFTTPNGEEDNDEDEENDLKSILVSNPINLSPYALLSAEKIPKEADQDEIRRRKKLALQGMLNDSGLHEDMCSDEPLSWLSCVLALLLCLPFFALIGVFISYFGIPDIF
ncbi:hypothetical protein TCAL_01976 [Tigriopus californicus]|uniref:Uncharacterized protein n=1 Tax=Tigriopus californicus TaxID=6832 RepID=A0A553PNH8_TIGCA|nr:uncharacterized protein LOC131882175 [Tigriopus californicus]TRY79239.1 hypothetical protein TCAL_01976 [Tigriopus californicus]|eukprot:TCALIF_01976-PA protein Name:"Protein of unknown function" AED:0.00 eAED:0.00 QI:100/1/1/1/1/1/2/18/115